MKFLLFAVFALAAASAPTGALACACGCGIFDVGTGSLFASRSGGEVFVEDDFMDQTHNWSGAGSAPAANNTDKEIRSDFVTAGVQYMFNHQWGFMVEVPVTNRYFRTDDSGSTLAFDHTAIGDIKVMGVYTGFSDDMSTGVIFGVKAPTGDWRYPGFDRDVEIGSGSIDALVGAYHVGNLTKSGKWTYFAQVMSDLPLAGQGGYRPGDEVDGAVGVYYNGWTFQDGVTKLAPLLQVLTSVRAHDGGPAADPSDSGYERAMISPGLELDTGKWKLYGDVELPLYQRVNGNQLVAPALFKVLLSRSF